MPEANYDIINRGLWELTERILVAQPEYTFLQKLLFGREGRTTKDDFTVIDYKELGLSTVPTEARKYQDPNYVNHTEGFMSRQVYPKYFFDEDSVNADDLKERVWNEPIDAPWSFEQRAMYHIAEKAKNAAKRYIAGIELMSRDLVFGGKYSTLEHGDQKSDVKESLLDISVATDWASNPLKALGAAAGQIRDVAGVTPNILIMNAQDASALMNNTSIQKTFDIRNYRPGIVEASAKPEPGVNFYGEFNIANANGLRIYSYSGRYTTGEDEDYFIPRGKAYLGVSNIGRIDYCGLLMPSEGEGIVAQDKRASKFFSMIYPKRHGALVSTFIQTQMAPAAVVLNPAGYGIITGIPA